MSFVVECGGEWGVKKIDIEILDMNSLELHFSGLRRWNTTFKLFEEVCSSAVQCVLAMKGDV